jgi:hypothetical protein
VLRAAATCRSGRSASDDPSLAAAFCCGLSLPQRFHMTAPAFTRGASAVPGGGSAASMGEQHFRCPLSGPDAMALEPRVRELILRASEKSRWCESLSGIAELSGGHAELAHSGQVGACPSQSPRSDGRLSGDRSGEGLPALPDVRLGHRPHPAPTAESLKAAEALHDLPIASLFHARFCSSEGDQQGATGAAEAPHHARVGGLFRPVDEFPPAQKAESPMVDPERTSPNVSPLALRRATCVLIRITSLSDALRPRRGLVRLRRHGLELHQLGRFPRREGRRSRPLSQSGRHSPGRG